MPNKKIVIANWKMNKTSSEAVEFVKELNGLIKNNSDKTVAVICPPFTAINNVKNSIHDSKIKLGAQNVYFEDNGAFTGEISCSMLKDAGCEYVLLGHSERRQYFHETNEIINKKVLKVLEAELKPVLCVGETLQEHQDKITEAVIEEQIAKCLERVESEKIENVIIAYEPVWAIGTGKNATPHQAETVHNFIRKKLKKLYSEDVSGKIRILYGGSINRDNAKELFKSDTINGGLVGGASLQADSFFELIKAAV